MNLLKRVFLLILLALGLKLDDLFSMTGSCFGQAPNRLRAKHSKTIVFHSCLPCPKHLEGRHGQRVNVFSFP